MASTDKFKINPFSLDIGEQILVGTSGIEIEGNVKSILRDQTNKPIYFNTVGPTQLCYLQKIIQGQSKKQHPLGFGSPLGKLKGIDTPLENLDQGKLIELGIEEGKRVILEFESGIIVNGELVKTIRKNGKIIIQTFKNVTVTGADGELLFKPSWGTYDMLVAEYFIVSLPIPKVQ